MVVQRSLGPIPAHKGSANLKLALVLSPGQLGRRTQYARGLVLSSKGMTLKVPFMEVHKPQGRLIGHLLQRRLRNVFSQTAMCFLGNSVLCRQEKIIVEDTQPSLPCLEKSRLLHLQQAPVQNGNKP